MKKLVCLFLAVFLLSSPALAASGDTIVYVTRTGECYHRLYCGHLRSCIEISLEVAVNRGYYPCDDCVPPTLDSDAVSALDSLARQKKESSSSSSGSHSSASAYVRNGGSSSPVSLKAEEKHSLWWYVGYVVLIAAAGWPVLLILFSIIGTVFSSVRKKKKTDDDLPF